MSFVLNSVSREKLITRPLPVPGTDGTLLRVLLDDYGIEPTAWNKLVQEGSGPAAQRTPEPYHYARIETVTEQVEVQPVQRTRQVLAGYDRYRRPIYRTETYQEQQQVAPQRKRQIKHGPAPWASPNGGQSALALSLRTASETPIVRADWFVTMASWAPGYYQLLGLGQRVADFEKMVFADARLAAQARSQVKGVVTFSPVALHNRTLIRMPTIATVFGGYYWESHDTVKSIDDRDYVNVLLDEKYDATEVIASLPNGLQAYFLTDAKGNRLDVAVAGIAQDHETILQDHQVFAARNCMTCHSSGIRPISDEIRSLSRDQVALLVADPKQARRIADLYFSHDLSAVVQHDQGVFTAAVRQTNGLTGPANAALFEKIVHSYTDQPLTPERVAAEAGVSEQQLRARLQKGVGIDHTLTGLLRDPPRPIRRDQFERSYGQLQQLLGGR